MQEKISISGWVHDYDMKPIYNIKVSAYDNLQYVDHQYTDMNGKYHLSITCGKPITVCFDTHWSLKNARQWHPSVVAIIDTKQDIILDRYLMHVSDSKGRAADIDALTAYQFIVMWTERFGIEKTYAEIAAYRVSQLMVVRPEVLPEFQEKLTDFFLKKSQSN
ncbi:hypothetical protein [Bacillus cereus]|uniref:hypothetical protein n=1 Tax=Bacillus cereus TaxID=1396 RepID=UPI00217CC7B7|nr:hypothetical protein [Bacillus cereus]MCS6595210.1 hypothetical protein [Bacillus cereus]